jgi:cytoskeletal protein RodZ
MKFLHAVAFAVILTVAGAPVLSAQEPQQDRDKPKQQDEEKKKQPPAPKEKPQTKPDERPKSEPQRDKETSKQDTDKQKHQQKEQETATRQQKQPTSEASQSATSQHGSRTNVRRIPPEHFRTNFGREHHFRVQRSGDRRFQYAGYSFELVEVWPAGWSYDDECYIEEDGDDYYLVDVVHPQIRVLVVIVG